MLEGYLSQTPKLMPDLQQEANKLAQEAMNQVQGSGNNSNGNSNSSSNVETT